MDSSGRILLTAGTVLKDRYIDRLRQMGLPAVYVWNDLAPDAVPPDVVSDQARQHLTTELGQTITGLKAVLQERGRSSARRWTGVPVARVRKAVNSVVDEILANRGAIVHLQDIRTHDQYTLAHSVNVCVLCTLVGSTMGYDAGKLRDLGTGAVLHDIGKITIPEEILNKPGDLTSEEMGEIRTHPQRGFEILCQDPEVSLHSAHVALQHHERWDGGGYPRGLQGTEIHEFGRIAIVADIYDALTTDRPYRPGLTPEQALRLLRSTMAGWFEPRVLSAFLECVAPYPIGTMVELNDGVVAVVTAVVRGQTDRPSVRVVQDPEGVPLSQPYTLDLATAPDIAITRVVFQPEDGAVEAGLAALGDRAFS